MFNTDLNTEVLDALFTHVDQVVFIRDVRISGFPIIYVNDAYTDIWAYSKEELYQKPESFIDSVHPEDQESVLRHAQEFLNGSVEMETKYRIIDANENIVHIRARTFLTNDETGIPKYIVGYARNVTDIEKHHATLLNLNATQDLLIQLLTQDLTLPVSGIKYLTRSANHQIRTEGKVRNTEYINEVVNQLNGVMKLLEDLLVYLEIQANRVRITYSKIEVFEQVNSVVKLYEDLAKSKGIEIRVQNSDNNVFIQTDILHFHQIIGNLLSNAIKFTPSNGLISVVVKDNVDFIEVFIEDTGVGIPANLLELVTSPFKGGRVGLEGERSFSIGLYISKELMKLMGGDLNISSQVSKGTKVCLVFPK